MDAHSYKNPYQNPSLSPPNENYSIDEALERLKDKRLTPHRFFLCLLQSDSQHWTEVQVNSFVEWLISEPSLEDGLWTLQWLVQEQWSVDLVYRAVSCHKSALLPFLLNDAGWTDQHRMFQAATASSLVSIWNILQQMQEDCSWSSGDAWWMGQDDNSMRTKLFQFALDSLMVQPDEWNPSLRKDDVAVSLCEFKTSQVELILHVVNADLRVPDDCLRRLSDEASRVRDNRLTATVYTRFSVTCFHLLSKITNDEQAFMPLLEDSLPKILLSAFSSPTQTNHAAPSTVSETSLQFAKCLFESRPATIRLAISRLVEVQSFAESTCAAIATNAIPTDAINHSIRRLQLLHRIDRSVVRECLSASFRQGQETNGLVECLTNYAKRHNSLPAASWLRELVADRRSVVRHDEFSQSLRCGCFLEFALELAKTENNAMLAIVADICCMVPPIYCSTEAVETLIQVVSPTRKPQNKPPKDGDFDSDTPTAANLSRLDGSMMNWSEAEELVPNNRPIDPSVGLSVALLLATVAPMCDPLIQSRAVEAAANALKENGSYSVSLDQAVRSLQLTNMLSNPDSEQYLAELAYSEGRRQVQENGHQRKIIERQEKTIQKLRTQVDTAVTENDSLRLELRQASSRFRVEKSEILQSSSREATKAIQGHLKEKQAAENLANDLALKLEEAEKNLLAVSQEAQSFKAQVDEANTRLQQSLEQKENFLCREKEMEAKLKKKEDIIVDAKERLQHSAEKETELLDRVQRQHDDIIDLQENETELRDGLENLFEDMVFLARMYEHKEKHASSIGSSRSDEVKSLKACVQKLQTENKDLTEREARLQYEKELQDKKYSKLREKLEQERREQRREDERRVQRSASTTGSASYMNHLHADSSSSRRRARHKSTESETEKENTSIASSRRSQMNR